ncbi:MAG: TolB family protein [Lutibacter sp.]
MKYLSIICAVFFLISCKDKSKAKADSYSGATKLANTVHYPQEKHLKNIKQLTFGGDNAEAYWNSNGTQLVFQSNNKKWGLQCDQIFTMSANKPLDSAEIPQKISTGLGRTTCSYFLPGDSTIVYASTHLKNKDCPPVPNKKDYGNKYVWPVYSGYDIFIADTKGNQIKQLTFSKGYDAEPTVSPKGDKIVFTSTRSGDLELYTMNIDGTNVKQITNELGYDGGAFFSPDGEKLIFRASRPKTVDEVKTYKQLLKQGLVQPTNMELFTCNVDGSNLKQITHLGGANWAPFFHPSGKKVIFSSNYKTKKSFNLFMINVDGTGIEQITYDTVFDAFPMFSPNGKELVFSSNRNNYGTHDTNLFVADWVE